MLATFDRRQMLNLGTRVLGAALPLAMLTACTSGNALVKIPSVDMRKAICDLYVDIKEAYPSIRAWVVAHRDLFSDEQWHALVDFERRAAQIKIALNAACEVAPAPETEASERWARGASTVIQVAQVGLKIGKLAMAAGVL